MKNRRIITLLMLLLTAPAAFSQKSADDVLTLNGAPQVRHSFNSDLAVQYQKKEKPVKVQVNISIDSSFIHISDGKDFNMAIPVTGTSKVDIMEMPTLFFSLEGGDFFHLSWDERGQVYSFTRLTSRKTRKNYPIIHQIHKSSSKSSNGVR